MRDKNGKFTKGNPGKPHGAKSKRNQDIKDNLKELLEDNLPRLKQDLDKLEPKDRVKAIMDLIKYYVPALKSTEMTVEDISKSEWKPIQINFSNDDNE